MVSRCTAVNMDSEQKVWCCNCHCFCQSCTWDYGSDCRQALSDTFWSKLQGHIINGRMIVNGNSQAKFHLWLWCLGVYLVSGIGPLGQEDNLASGVEHIFAIGYYYMGNEIRMNTEVTIYIYSRHGGQNIGFIGFEPWCLYHLMFIAPWTAKYCRQKLCIRRINPHYENNSVLLYTDE